MSDFRSLLPTAVGFLWLGLLPMGCSPERGPDLRDVPTDVEIIRVGEDLLRSQRRLRLQDLRVATELGGTDERAGHVFSGPPSGRLLEGGRILLADSDFAEVRLYRPAGRLAFRIGRHGQGPGEFSRIAWIGVRGRDTVVAWDPSSARITYFSSDGDLLEVVHADPTLTAQRRTPFLGMFSDGSFPLRVYEFRPIPEDPGIEEFTDTARYLLFGPDGSYQRELLRARGDERFVYRGPGSAVMISPVFGATQMAAAAGDRFIYTQSGTPVVWELSPEGDTVRVWEFDLPRRRPTERDLRAFRERLPFSEDPTGIEARFADAWDEAPVRAELPFFERLVGMSDGNVWLGLHTTASDEERTWVVLARDGSVGPVVLLPRGYEILDVLGNRMLVVIEDSLGRPTVRSLSGALQNGGPS